METARAFPRADFFFIQWEKGLVSFLPGRAGPTPGPAAPPPPPPAPAVAGGAPAGLRFVRAAVNRELARRQVGYGRGERMQIEKDEVEVLSGVRFGRTLGGPVAMLLRNRDWENWREKMAQEGQGGGIPPLTTTRPGHADLGGILKYCHRDVRNVLERASARETAARVAAGALARVVLREVGVEIAGHVVSIGKVRVSREAEGCWDLAVTSEKRDLRMAEPAAAGRAAAVIDRARKVGRTGGGTVEMIARGVPPGLGSAGPR